MHMTYYIQLTHAHDLLSTAYSCTMHYYLQLTHAQCTTIYSLLMHMTYYIQLTHAQCTTIYSLLMHNALQSTAYSCTMHYYMQLTHAHDLLWPCHVLSTPTERCTTLPVYCRITQWDTRNWNFMNINRVSRRL